MDFFLPGVARSACRIGAGLLAAGLVAGAAAQAPAAGRPHAKRHDEEAAPFKVAKIYFETNASACDMGIQITFDTEGVKKVVVADPHDHVIHLVRAGHGLLGIGGQTEGFLESVEPVVTDLLDANPDCQPDPDEPTTTLDQIRRLFPPGTYDFEGVARDGSQFEDEAELTYNVPDGPELESPDGESGVDPNVALVIHWKAVTMTIPGLLPGGAQMPVDIAGYEVLVFDANAGESPQLFDVTVPGTETSVTVGPEFLQPNTDYNIEVLAIEVGHNQTITEGSFSTGP
jgi:hypothetical protein